MHPNDRSGITSRNRGFTSPFLFAIPRRAWGEATDGSGGKGDANKPPERGRGPGPSRKGGLVTKP